MIKRQGDRLFATRGGFEPSGGLITTPRCLEG